MQEQLVNILSSHSKERQALIPILQRIQEEFSYIPEEAVSQVAAWLGLSPNQVYGVASFYAQFCFSRRGKHVINVCQGTACHVRGAVRILETLERELDIKQGETTPDYKFSLERVACFGSCALAPVLVIDKNVYGRVTPTKAKEILSKYRLA